MNRYANPDVPANAGNPAEVLVPLPHNRPAGAGRAVSRPLSVPPAQPVLLVPEVPPVLPARVLRVPLAQQALPAQQVLPV